MKSLQRRKQMWGVAVYAVIGMMQIAHGVAAPQVSVSSAYIKDDRDSRDQLSSFKVGVKVQGGILDQARALRIVVKSAEGETGQNLLPDIETSAFGNGFAGAV